MINLMNIYGLTAQQCIDIGGDLILIVCLFGFIYTLIFLIKFIKEEF